MKTYYCLNRSGMFCLFRYLIRRVFMTSVENIIESELKKDRLFVMERLNYNFYRNISFERCVNSRFAKLWTAEFAENFVLSTSYHSMNGNGQKPQTNTCYSETGNNQIVILGKSI